MEEGRGGLGAMEWRTGEAGVSRLVERAFWHPRSMNGEMEGGGTKGEQCFGLGRACLKFGESYKLPPSKILDILRVGGRTVISGVRIDFGRAHGCLGAHGV